MASFYW